MKPRCWIIFHANTILLGVPTFLLLPQVCILLCFLGYMARITYKHRRAWGLEGLLPSHTGCINRSHKQAMKNWKNATNLKNFNNTYANKGSIFLHSKKTLKMPPPQRNTAILSSKQARECCSNGAAFLPLPYRPCKPTAVITGPMVRQLIFGWIGNPLIREIYIKSLGCSFAQWRVKMNKSLQDPKLS